MNVGGGGIVWRNSGKSTTIIFLDVIYCLNINTEGGNHTIHCTKSLSVLPSPAGMSLTKLSLDGNNLIITVQGEFRNYILAGRETAYLF
jgi:hypothetical protein